MRDGSPKKNKLSWLKKWFNIKNKGEDFQAEEIVYRGSGEEWSNSFPDREACTTKRSKTEKSRRDSGHVQGSKLDQDGSPVTDLHSYKIFVATWNVAGKSPPSYMNIEDWLHTSPPADIYVLGFQEIVPLNAGNVLGSEDNGPARKWVALIQKTLNTLPGISRSFQAPWHIPDPVVELDADFENSTRQKNSSFLQRHSFQSFSRSLRMMDRDISMPQPPLDRRFSVCDPVILAHRPSDYDPGSSSDDENGPCDLPCTMQCSPISYSQTLSKDDKDRQSGQSGYCLVMSKQMVGIFLTVWVKSDLRGFIHNMKVSCIGRGLMGYLGNKGSISISMSLHRTSFCFVCSHLTSGQKEGDELRRNSDVMEILRKTRFPRVHSMDKNSPQTILEHDRVIWLGDLNYRIALSYRTAKALVEMRNWRALLENDQLRIEQRRGHVFQGWNEGKIYFPPTYKYLNNSDRYAGDNTKEKRRTPAWCDRILWFGRGLHQMSYVRAESKFSDHRPVYSVFLVEVESISHNHNKKTTNCSSRIEVEELLPYSY